MYILLIASTSAEISIMTDQLRDKKGVAGGHEVEVLITGVGCTAATYALTRQLLWRTPELVIQAGIGGSFTESLPPGSVVMIRDEVLADLGAAHADEFDDIFDLGFAGANDHPFSQRSLVNPYTDRWLSTGLPFVRGATVHQISSTAAQVQRIIKKYNPAIESMEGAALHYTCLMEHVPFLQLRAVSNRVGERDKQQWKIKESITALNQQLRRIIETHN